MITSSQLQEPRIMPFQIYFLEESNSLSNSADQDQTARSVQSDLALQCSQKGQRVSIKILRAQNKVVVKYSKF